MVCRKSFAERPWRGQRIVPTGTVAACRSFVRTSSVSGRRCENLKVPGQGGFMTRPMIRKSRSRLRLRLSSSASATRSRSRRCRRTQEAPAPLAHRRGVQLVVRRRGGVPERSGQPRQQRALPRHPQLQLLQVVRADVPLADVPRSAPVRRRRRADHELVGVLRRDASRRHGVRHLCPIPPVSSGPSPSARPRRACSICPSSWRRARCGSWRSFPP